MNGPGLRGSVAGAGDPQKPRILMERLEQVQAALPSAVLGSREGMLHMEIGTDGKNAPQQMKGKHWSDPGSVAQTGGCSQGSSSSPAQPVLTCARSRHRAGPDIPRKTNTINSCRKSRSESRDIPVLTRQKGTLLCTKPLPQEQSSTGCCLPMPRDTHRSRTARACAADLCPSPAGAGEN